MMAGLPTGWKLARFDTFITRIDRKIIVDEETTYNCVGVRWYGHGAFIREKELGLNIARKQQWMIKTGDVVYNKLFAWKGAFAIADDLVDGCIVSDKFPTYLINQDLVEPKFLQYFFKTPQLARQAQDLSKGAAAISKLTLNPPQFWELIMPMPSLEEQRRIVRRIEALAARVREALYIRESTMAETAALHNSAITGFLGPGRKHQLLKAVIREPLRNGLSIPASKIGEHGLLFAKVGIVNSGKINPAENKRVNIELDDDSPYWMKPGDIFVSRGNSLELVGRTAVYEGIPEKIAFPDLLIRIRVDIDSVDPFFISRYFHSQEARKYLEIQASGTSPSMKKVSQPKLENMPIPDISLDEQRRIVAHLDAVQTKLDELRRLQSETQQELSALMPAILDRAFKGEL